MKIIYLLDFCFDTNAVSCLEIGLLNIDFCSEYAGTFHNFARIINFVNCKKRITHSMTRPKTNTISFQLMNVKSSIDKQQWKCISLLNLFLKPQKMNHLLNTSYLIRNIKICNRLHCSSYLMFLIKLLVCLDIVLHLTSHFLFTMTFSFLLFHFIFSRSSVLSLTSGIKVSAFCFLFFLCCCFL